MKNAMIIVLFMVIGIGSQISASEIVWKPINPAFGGYYYNAQWLMSTAQAQKTKDTSSPYSYSSRDPLKDFQESLNRQILSRLSSKLITQMFGEAELEPGHYEIGDYIIDVTPGEQGIRIDISDPVTGQDTSIELPYYGGN